MDAGLKSRVKSFDKQTVGRKAQRKSLAADLGRAIFDRLIELYGKRESRSSSFELWLSQQFDTDGDPVLTETDEKLVQLVRAVDRVHGRPQGRREVAAIVNDLLRQENHEFGLNGRLIDVEPLTGRRLSHTWRGNPPRN